MKICPKCGSEHSKPGTYCSRHCANSRIRNEEIKRKTRESLRNTLARKGIIMKPSVKVICKTCKKEFIGNSDTQFCSCSCVAKYYRENSLKALKKANEKLKENNNWGGYREGSGRAKTGYYKGIYCGSTYELAWVIYQLDHGFAFERFKGELSWNGIKYIPDFLQDGKIVEIKGYEDQASVDKKTEVANYYGYEVIVLREKDLKKEFEWVQNHYKCKHLQELYDDYKPAYSYVCDNCGTEFSREHISNERHKFCSRKCAGQYASKRLHGAIE